MKLIVDSDLTSCEVRSCVSAVLGGAATDVDSYFRRRPDATTQMRSVGPAVCFGDAAGFMSVTQDGGWGGNEGWIQLVNLLLSR